MVLGNFVINFLLSASMQLMWGLINCLQFFVHLPLLRL